MLVEMTLKRVLIRETDDTHVVELSEKGGDRVLPIMIGLVEAAAIERRLMGHEPPRPLTHELLAQVVEATGWTLDRVVITDLAQHTFFARVFLVQGEVELDIDARPSDAIALGCAEDVRIFVAEEVLLRACP